jgi:hypothetical protein
MTMTQRRRPLPGSWRGGPEFGHLEDTLIEMLGVSPSAARRVRLRVQARAAQNRRDASRTSQATQRTAWGSLSATVQPTFGLGCSGPFRELLT